MATAPSQAEGDVKEAEQYWGYLISPDRTGTDKLKNLLRGLHSLIGSTFEPYDSSDLTPPQLARFYRACNGQYDQLFLETPPSTIAFIYKNLGCSHSLQPLPVSAAEPRYSDPTIPALKTEGWIVWSTIQLLLAPDEHAEFLRRAVGKWDVKVPGTNETFPKILPRSCFPPAPDPTMQNWYDGMTERLRREMEEEEHTRIKIAEERPDSPMHKHRRLRESRHVYSSDEESPEDSKDFALAYFRNPLFRTVDGRPGVVRRGSKRPTLSPRPSFVQRGKTAAATVGRVVQNVASPHLWDGHPTRHAADHHRRKSLPDKHRHQDDENANSSTKPSPTGLYPSRHHDRARRGSHQADSPPGEHAYWNSGTDSPRRTHSQRSRATSPDLHQRRSHEAHPSPKEYFPPPSYDGEANHTRRNSATHLDPRSAGTAGLSNSPAQGGSGFGPSVSPLFATHVARGEVPGYSYRSGSRPPLQRRADYRSPERTMPQPRPSSGREREEWEGSDSGSGVGRSRSQRQQHIKAVPGGSRHGTPVSFGVDGRRYAVPSQEMPYRGSGGSSNSSRRD